ncbi:MAG: TrmH family RNA methyltransferase [Bacteroidota bacterium]
MVRKATRSELAFISSLHRSNNRREAGLFFAEGVKVVGELLRSQIKLKWLVGLPSYFEENHLLAASHETISVSPAELERISGLATPNQVVAVAEIPSASQILFQPIGQTLLLLDGISDPGNLGTLVRTAEWFGVTAVIASNGSVDFWNPKVVQAAMGSLFRMPVIQSDLSTVLDQAKASGISYQVGGVLDGSPLSSLSRKNESMALVVGSESHGITVDIQSRLTHRLTIAQSAGSQTESLNATVAAGIMMHHFQLKNG